MKTETLVYYQNGDVCKFSADRDKKEINDMKLTAQSTGHVGYLKGYHYYFNNKVIVYVFMTYKPDFAEIDRRRRNGFKGATYYSF